MNKLNILFLFVSLPELKGNNGLFSSLIKEFRNHGHNIFVSAKGEQIKRTQIKYEDGTPVLRIKSYDFTGVKSNVNKALAYQEYSIKQACATYRFFKNTQIDLIISHSLPPELALIISPLKRKFKCLFYLIQTDFTWQDAVAFGYFNKNGIIARYYRHWERKMFQLADYIGCPTKGNITFIKKEYTTLADSKFQLLPFWQNEIEVIPEYKIKERYGFNGKFVVIYGGSLGAAQRTERIVELAELCKEYEDIQFVILGRGTYVPVIEKMILERELTNVVVKEFLPLNEYMQLLASCDVGLIILNEKMATPNFPSKALTYFNMKIPILAALDYVTDFGDYLSDNNAGLWAYCDDLVQLKSELLKYYNSIEFRESVKENAYNLFRNELTPLKAYQRMMSKINQTYELRHKTIQF